MKTTRARFSLNGLREKAQEDRGKREDYAARVKAIAAEINKTEAAIKDALSAADVEKYTSLKEHRNKLEEDLETLHQNAPVPRSYEIRSATHKRWKEYADAYNADFSAKYETFKKNERKLCQDYLDLVEMQDEALQCRGEYLGFVNDNNLVTEDGECFTGLAMMDANDAEISLVLDVTRLGKRIRLEDVVKRQIPGETRTDAELLHAFPQIYAALMGNHR